MADLKVAVIGCGGHAQEHFRMIAAEPRLHLVAISEVDGKRLEQNRRQWKPERAFSDYRRMLDTCALAVDRKLRAQCRKASVLRGQNGGRHRAPISG